jgi:Protein of unknown function (DUF982)
MKWFSPPVPVRTNHPGRRYEVSSVEVASEQVLQWQKRGPKCRKAIEICMETLGGRKTPQEARAAFEAAAREAGMLLE